MQETLKTIEFDPSEGFFYSHLSQKLVNRIRHQMHLVKRFRKEKTPFRIRFLTDGKVIVEQSKAINTTS